MKTAHLLFASAFLSALVAVACKGTVIGPGLNPPGCPESFPDGAACGDAPGACVYTAGDCDITYACESGEWTPQPADCATECLEGGQDSPCLIVGDNCGIGDECNDEYWTCGPDHLWDVEYTQYDDCCYDCECWADQCPGSPPNEGDWCDPCYDSPDCYWESIGECGMGGLSAQCGDDYTWHVTGYPPPPCEDCSSHVTVEGCDADPACRYLSPGCDTPTLSVGGCFPIDDCAPDSACAPGTTCTQVNANTCGLDPCVQCEVALVCL